MRRGHRNTALIAFGLLTLTASLVLSICRDAQRVQKKTQELSRMMSVRIIVSSALSDYYKTNSSYPTSLEELPSGLLRWGDEGSSTADLKLLRYSSTSNTFMLFWERGTNTDLFVGGRTGQLYWNEKDFENPLQAKH